MAFLKFVCVSSCIGGLIPLMASTESLPLVAEQLAYSFDVEHSARDRGIYELTDTESSRKTTLSIAATQQVHQFSVYAIDVFDKAIYPTRQSDFSMQVLPQDEANDAALADVLTVASHLSQPVEVYGMQMIQELQAKVEQLKIEQSVQIVSVSSERIGESLSNTPFKLDSPQETTAYSMVNLGYCSLVNTFSHAHNPAHIADVDSQNTSVARDITQVHINDQVVAEFAQQGEAHYFAETIKSIITAENFQPHTLEPRPHADEFVIAASDTSVEIADTIPNLLKHSEDLVAIAWTNNLRVALGAEPLSLGEAQAQVQALESNGHEVKGIASWYGPYFHGRTTASGERFNQNELTAAHPSLPFDTYLNVTNLKNGRTIVVRINDRGPYVGRRTLDLSRRAAQCLGSEDIGVVPYSATLLETNQAAYGALAKANLN